MAAEAEGETAGLCQYFIDSSDEKAVQVFSNPLIWNVLGSHLDYLDLKEYRLVCSGFNKMITGETDFHQRTLVDLASFISECPQTWRLVDWRHVKIDVSRLSRILQAEELNKEEEKHCEGRESEEEEGDNEAKVDGWMITRGSGVLKALLDLMKNVESLFLYASLEMTAQYIVDLLECASSLKLLSVNLTNIRVDLRQSTCKKFKFSNTLKEAEVIATPPSRGFSNSTYPSEFLFNLLLRLRGAKLESIKITKILPELRFVTSDESEYALLSLYFLLSCVVKPHLVQLRALEINDPTLWAIANKFLESPLRGEPLPGLKSLKAEAIYDPPRTTGIDLARFIQNQTQLHEIRVKCMDFFPQVLFDAIKTQGLTLKRLCITTKRFAVEEQGMWNFLTGTEIEEFELVLEPFAGFCRGLGNVDTIFASFPNTVKKVVIRGFPARMRATPLTDFHSIIPELLSELVLSRCGGIVSDETVQLICKNFLLLEKLNISKASRVTDYGLIGEKDHVDEPGRATSLALRGIATGMKSEGEATGANISNLRELKQLNLRCCSRITDRTLTRGIKFLRLQFLDLSGIRNVTAEACSLLKTEIPRLKILRKSISPAYSQRPRVLSRRGLRGSLRSLSLDSFSDD